MTIPVEWLTPAEIANELRVSNMTVYRLIRLGYLHGIRVGRSMRVTRDAFDSFVESQRIEGAI